MTDPFSLATGVAGLVSFGIQATQSLHDYYVVYRGQDEEIDAVTQNLSNLLLAFQELDFGDDTALKSNDVSLLHKVAQSLGSCRGDIEKLEKVSHKCRKTSIDAGVVAYLKAQSFRAAYPFQRGTLIRLEERISRIRETLNSSLALVQFKRGTQTNSSLERIENTLESLKSDAEWNSFVDWLDPPDVLGDYNTNLQKRHPDTGHWFIRSPVFEAWLNGSIDAIWIHGFAGMGKSILYTTIAEETRNYSAARLNSGVAFYNFSFNDSTKQSDLQMIRALTYQLASQVPFWKDECITKFIKEARPGQSSRRELLITLESLIHRLEHVYIIIDALDECPSENDKRAETLQTIDLIRRMSRSGVNILATSRYSADINDSLLDTNSSHRLDKAVPNPWTVLPMNTTEVDKDIEKFVRAQLKISRSLARWEKMHTEIEQSLASKAGGVFRYVQCQLTSLERRPQSEAIIRKRLQTLPESLEGTYDRILANIDQDLQEYAKRLLMVLCCALRPLNFSELADSTAVDTQRLVFDIESRFPARSDLEYLCPGFVEVIAEHRGDDLCRREDLLLPNHSRTIPGLRIAHFSVFEYLQSEYLRKQVTISYFHFTVNEAHNELLQLCLTYLLKSGMQFKSVEKVNDLSEFPLAVYASVYWISHLWAAEEIFDESKILLEEFFGVGKAPEQAFVFHNWQQLIDADQSILHEDLETWRQTNFKRTKLVWASYLGLDSIVKSLLSTLDGSTNNSSLPGCRHQASEHKDELGLYTVALHAAAQGGHSELMRLLISKGADACTNVEGALCELQQELFYKPEDSLGHVGTRGERASKLTYERKLDFWRKSYQYSKTKYGSVIHRYIRSRSCSVDTLANLLEAGADVNAKDSSGKLPLEFAVRNRNLAQISFLLDHGSMINVFDHFGRSPLITAMHTNDVNLVRLLLDRGADVNLEANFKKPIGSVFDPHNNPLNAAVHAIRHSTIEVLELLYSYGADVGGDDEKGLTAALQSGDIDKINLLIKRGLKMSARHRVLDAALVFAAWKQSTYFMNYLLASGADVNAQVAPRNYRPKENQPFPSNSIAGSPWTPLGAAVRRPNKDKVQALLKHGATVNPTDKIISPLWHAASINQYENVKDLLELGANTDTNSRDGTALHAASIYEDGKVLELLLGAGADANKVSLNGLSVLSFACLCKADLKQIKRLVSAGAKVNAQEGEYGSPLISACYHCSCDVVEFLIQQGADVNAFSDGFWDSTYARDFFPAGLIEAPPWRRPHSPQAGTALHQACCSNSDSRAEVLRLLIDSGADVNACHSTDETALDLIESEGKIDIEDLLKKHGAKYWHELNEGLLEERFGKSKKIFGGEDDSGDEGFSRHKDNTEDEDEDDAGEADERGTRNKFKSESSTDKEADYSRDDDQRTVGKEHSGNDYQPTEGPEWICDIEDDNSIIAEGSAAYMMQMELLEVKLLYDPWRLT